MSSRRTYDQVAKCIRNVRNSYFPHWDPNLFRALDDVTKEMAAAFKRENDRFSVSKFFDACGMERPEEES